ncbi:MAG: hypothetical protein KKA65_00835 [Nanoarchaeota archaeon]|nr:hypothetical protein [Nanoarchaeota archaeon]MBU4242254.1 hypothetical protein [Nanoarchaeota archaeon]MBU4352267.1 hypothetical protein [Nanoarchaeota archaeon]MBU4456023.1 hypothetical protein [Nanoarchaeota archaeon]MCG2719533.1 hypothetical protein [Nanoarchaeota archaeon]
MRIPPNYEIAPTQDFTGVTGKEFVITHCRACSNEKECSLENLEELDKFEIYKVPIKHVFAIRNKGNRHKKLICSKFEDKQLELNLFEYSPCGYGSLGY